MFFLKPAFFKALFPFFSRSRPFRLWALLAAACLLTLPTAFGQKTGLEFFKAAVEGGEITEEQAQMMLVINELNMDLRSFIGSMIEEQKADVRAVLEEKGLIPSESLGSVRFITNLISPYFGLEFMQDNLYVNWLAAFLKNDIPVSQRKDEMWKALEDFKASFAGGAFKKYVEEKADRDLIKKAVYVNSFSAIENGTETSSWFGNQIYGMSRGGDDLELYAIGLPTMPVMYSMSHEQRKSWESKAYMGLIEQMKLSKPEIIGINMRENHFLYGVMELAEYIRDNQLDVYILGYCSTACSSYLLPAARDIYIGPYGIILYEASSFSIAGEVGKKIEESMKTSRESYARKIEDYGGVAEYFYELADETIVGQFLISMFSRSMQGNPRAFLKIFENFESELVKIAPLESLSKDETVNLFADFTPDELQAVAGFLFENAPAISDSDSGTAPEEKKARFGKIIEEAGGFPNYFWAAPIEAKEERLKSYLEKKNKGAGEKFHKNLRAARSDKYPMHSLDREVFVKLFADFTPEDLQFVSDFIFNSQYQFHDRDKLYKFISQEAEAEREFFSNLDNPVYADFLRFAHSFASYNPWISEVLRLDSEKASREEKGEQRKFRYIVPSTQVLRDAGLSIIGENRVENLFNDPQLPPERNSYFLLKDIEN